MEFKKDRFQKSRGGPSRELLLSCAKCGNVLFAYQKDGTGSLKRLYRDRIMGSNLATKDNLVCPGCGDLIGVSMVYKKESRPAFRLIPGKFSKKLPSNK
ncbi:MAG: hypothetical protein KBC81_02230 [Candidatus Pacebacteria bacterium]|nr:hypothetical protein [Candidatus Paceibacterota bacterium]